MERIGEDNLSDDAPVGVVAVTNMTEAELNQAIARWAEIQVQKTVREMLWLTEDGLEEQGSKGAREREEGKQR